MSGNPWSAYWVEAAVRTTNTGDGHLGEDRLFDARDCYLRAAEYYRLALRGAEPGTAEHRSWNDAQVSAFRAALPLLPHPATPFAITVDSRSVVGYLFRSAVAAHPVTVVCPTVEHLPPESLYHPTAAPILELGLNCVVYGVVRGNFSAGRAPEGERDSHRVIDSVADWVLRQPGIDARGILLAPSNRGTH